MKFPIPFNKYKAKKTSIDNIVFASKKEADTYLILKNLEKRKIIKNLELQKKFVLQKGFADIYGNKIREISYIADFVYETSENIRVVEDVKGIRTPVYILKKKMFLKKYPQCLFLES